MTRPNDELTRLLERSQRGLDLHLPARNNRDHQLLLVLLPLTSPQGTGVIWHGSACCCMSTLVLKVTWRAWACG